MENKELAKVLRKKIISGEYPGGHRLIELKLSKDFNVKRNRVREAIQELNKEGFVNIIPYKGAFVSILTQKDIAQIYDLIGALEGLAMRVATPTISNKEIDEIISINRQVEQNRDDPVLVYEFNVKLHRYLTCLSNNERLIAFVENLRQQAYRMSLENFYIPGQIQSSLNEHKNIIKYIEKRNALKVENLIRNHYKMSRDRLIKNMNNSL